MTEAWRCRCVIASIVGVIPTILEELDNDNCVASDIMEIGSDGNAVIAALSLFHNTPMKTVSSACVEGFVEETVPGYSVDDFRSHFRMSRKTFEVI
jgi:hypothetical protein